MKKVDVTFKEVDVLIGKIVDQIKEEKIEITKIIAISRGGLVPARLLSKRLGVRNIYSIGITMYDENNKAGEPKIYQELPKFHAEDNVVIIDDVVESSISMKIAEKHARIKGVKNLWTAAVYVKEKHGVMPDFFGAIGGNEWINFPWEN